jgi:ribosomal protein L3 glutamine methyltransferase
MTGDNDKPARLAADATVADAIEWSAARFDSAGLFFGHGTENSLDEAAALVMHMVGANYPVAARVYREVLDAAQRQRLAEIVDERIATRKPAAYLIREAWFAGLRFYVDERVLVPRSPIAELISDRFEPWCDSGAVRNILDLCTGSGCIGVACAEAFPDAAVDASDVSEDALAVAAINVERFGLADRVELVRSDIFNELEGRRYDLIVSNPPYVSLAEMAKLPPEYVCEPGLGLEAGADGLRLVRRILDNARTHMTDNGLLVVEVGASQTALEAAYPRVPFTWVEFEHGGEGVFVMTSSELDEFRAEIEAGGQRKENGG